MGCFGKSTDADTGGTIIVHSDKSKNKQFCDNFITTSKYTWWNFLPLNLYHQFTRVSNIYFLANMCIALVPGVSPINPLTAIMPLVFVLGVAAVKDGYEDWQRHKDDERWNSARGKKDDNGNHLSGVIRNGTLDADLPSKSIEVGDIIKIVRNETIRADAILLATSDEKEHTAFIETMQLDGETNAKHRQAVQTTHGTVMKNLTESLTTIEACSNADLQLQCVGPSPDLHDWTGRLIYRGVAEGVSINQFLFRGSVLTNTSWAMAMVVYTGVDTKMQRNNKPRPQKLSALDKKLNRMIVAVLIVQHVVIFLMCGLAVWFREKEKNEAWYIDYYLEDHTDVELFFWRYMTYFILMSFMIPISLFVTIELTKAAQAKFMEWDRSMYTQLRDANNEEIKGGEPVGCKPRTSNLNEQLAIVKYIFSDKTGTLTENRMEFHTGEIGNPEHSELAFSGKGFRNPNPEERRQTGTTEGEIAVYMRQKHQEGKLQGPPRCDASGRVKSHLDNVIWYMLNLAMCHELSILQDETPKKDSTTQYQGASPDEVALAKTAQFNGVEFLTRSSSSMTISIMGVRYIYRIMDTLPFTSKRKMMSIVLQGPCKQSADGELIEQDGSSLFCLTKGADSVMMNRCAGAMGKEYHNGREVWKKVPDRAPDSWYSESYYERLNGELEKLGGIGLRTLVLAYRPIADKAWYTNWHQQYAVAKKIVGVEEREKLMEASWDSMERDFYICGATAIEDQLQDKVPETIQMLLRSGIVIWMLTGDKQETAETIAGTARLVDKETWQICYLTAHLPGSLIDDASKEQEERDARRVQREAWVRGLAYPTDSVPVDIQGVREVTEAYQLGQSFGKGDFLHSALDKAKKAVARGQSTGLVTDGATLGVIIPPGPYGLQDPLAKEGVEQMWADFVELSQIVNSGVLCRLTPDQKGQIVRVFQKRTGHTALAVGDGANDVPMISESYVGIGIMGLEGSQAVLASDYAVPRFKHLRRLLLVHGRFSLYRNSMCILFSFYKNFTLALIQIYFSFMCGFSGQTIFDSWLLAFQNFAFTSVPPLFVGIFEKDIGEEIVEEVPALYRQLRDGLYFDQRALLMWFGEAIWHSAVLFWLTYSTQRNDDIGGEEGRTSDLLTHGALILTCQIFCVLMKLSLHIRCWVSIQVFGVAISFAMFMAFICIYSLIPILFGDASFYHTGLYLLADPKYWLWAVFFVFGIIFTIDLPLLYIQRQYFPTKRDIAQRLMMQRRAAAREHAERSPTCST